LVIFGPIPYSMALEYVSSYNSNNSKTLPNILDRSHPFKLAKFTII
jgi:hypothetical protein